MDIPDNRKKLLATVGGVALLMGVGGVVLGRTVFAPDAGAPDGGPGADAGADAGTLPPDEDGEGCGCSASRPDAGVACLCRFLAWLVIRRAGPGRRRRAGGLPDLFSGGTSSPRPD